MNLYGFAGGDPVNYRDPFGLCPIDKDGIPCSLTWGAAGLLAGGAAGAVFVGATGTVVLPVVGTVVGAAGGFVLGGLAFGTAGVLAGGLQDIASMSSQGLSWWDKMQLRIKIVIGAALTEGKLQQREVDQERAKQQQTQDAKRQEKDRKKQTPDDPSHD